MYVSQELLLCSFRISRSWSAQLLSMPLGDPLIGAYVMLTELN